MCIPNNESEAADNSRETQACHKNGFEFLWYLLKVVVDMTDRHIVLKLPEFKGNLLQHAGGWNVHQILMTARYWISGRGKSKTRVEEAVLEASMMTS